MSSVVGVNPPWSFTGLGAFTGRALLDAIPLRMNSAIASFSFFCSYTARIFTSRMRSSGRSRVVFNAARIPESWFYVNTAGFEQASLSLRRDVSSQTWVTIRTGFCKRRVGSAQRSRASRSWLRGGSGQYRQLQFLAECCEARVILIIQNEGRA